MMCSPISGRSCLVFSALVLVFFGQADATAKDDKRPSPIDGNWTLVTAEFAGQPIAGLKGAMLSLVHGKKTFTLPDGKIEKGTYRVDSKNKPPHLDSTTEGRAETALGIYKLTGDTLKMCLSQSGKERPSKFVTSADTDFVLIVFKRKRVRLAKGDRLLGIGVNEGKIGFAKAFRAAQSAGVQVIELSQQWDDIEPKPGQFKNVFLDIANIYYPKTKTKLVITFNPIDTTALRLPADLRGKPLDDPQVIARYNKALEYVLSRVPNIELVGLAIGNEIDGYLGADKKKWKQYTRFFKATSAHVRRKRPGLPVGTKVMLPSVIGGIQSQVQAINKHADVLMTTYYPLGKDFKVKAPSVVFKDIDRVIELYKDKPVYFLEAGYPSSRFLGSSEAKQAEFIGAMFKAWDRHRKQIKLVNFIWLHDISEAEVKSYLKYYGLSSKGFAAYLGSLGMRTHDGKDKQGFKALLKESKARGW